MSIDKENIKQEASKLVKYSKDYPPVGVVDISHSLKYKVYHLDTNINNSLSGKVDYKEKKIYVNSLEPKQRQRFTIAHEIGHIILHEKINGSNNRETRDKDLMVQSNSIEEIEANIFASHLLMPDDEFYNQWKFNGGSLNITANYFFVSLLAANIKANSLHLTSI